MNNRDILLQNTASLDEKTDELIIIDQTRLPNERVFLRLSSAEEVFRAIKELQVRGAPAIGVAAAIGMYAVSCRLQEDEYAPFKDKFMKLSAYFAGARPTAVNLSWALDRMNAIVLNNTGLCPKELRPILKAEALSIMEKDIRVCRAIGENGLSLIKDGDGILTHCNAGQFAAVRYGTALAPIHLGRERGMNFRVFADETRPLLQGARLSAYELAADGVDVTLICDNMASSVMKNGWVQAVFVGCDRVAANGDTANKIGTSGVAILAEHYGIPFYVCAPLSTIDMSCMDGEHINIEQRPGSEVTDMWYLRPMAPEGVKVYNPAFDVTDNCMITAFVTEDGIIYPPFKENFECIFNRRR